MRQRGFTLLEMVIGMTLLGFVLALLYGGLRLGTRSWDSGERMVEATARQGAVTDFLRRQLTQVYPLYWKRDGQEVIAFAGERNALRFAGAMPARLGAGGIHLLSLAGEEAEDGTALRLRWAWPQPESRDFDFPDEDDKVVLVSGLEEIEFAYFGAESAVSEPQWHEEWRNAQAYPTLIRARLRTGDGAIWPDIVVAPVLGKSSGELSGGARICILC